MKMNLSGMNVTTKVFDGAANGASSFSCPDNMNIIINAAIIAAFIFILVISDILFVLSFIMLSILIIKQEHKLKPAVRKYI